MKYLILGLLLITGCTFGEPKKDPKYDSIKYEDIILVVSGFYEGCYGKVNNREPYRHFEVELGGKCRFKVVTLNIKEFKKIRSGK